MRAMVVFLLTGLLLMTRVRVCLLLRYSRDPKLILRIGWLGDYRSLHLSSLVKDSDRIRQTCKSLTPAKRAALLSALPGLLHLLRRLRLHTFALQIQTADAARAALWHGTLHTLGQLLCAARPRSHTRLSCRCTGYTELQIEGIISLRLGQIMLAAAAFAAAYAKRRFPQWTSIPSKAS